MVRAWRNPWWACVLALTLQCNEEPRRGQLMVVLQTDMSIPKGVDRIRLQVIQEGNFRHDSTYYVKPDGTTALPASLAIVAGEQPNDTVEVRVIGLRGDEARVLSKVITTVPRSRIAMLRVPIQWLCVGEVNEIDEDTYESTCRSVDEQEYACVAGTCQPVNIDPAVLSAYKPSEIFGGGEAPGDPLGQCFDTELCFENGVDVVPDSSCKLVVDVPRNRELNVALKLPGLSDDPEAEEGICGEAGCFVPLDRDDTYGWAIDDGGSMGGGDAGAAGESNAGSGESPGTGAQRLAVSLPQGVCDRIDEQRIEAVRISTSCQTKTPEYPTCGPWSSVGEALVVRQDSTSVTTSGSGGASSTSTTGGVMASGGESSTGSAMPEVTTDTTGTMGTGTSAVGSGGAVNPVTMGVGSVTNASVTASTIGGVTTGAGTTGDAEGTGRTPCPVPGLEDNFPLIDDFEDGANVLPTYENRNGFWGELNDGSAEGFQTTVPLLGAPTSDGMLHSSGSGFTDWGAGVLVTLRVNPDESPQLPCPYDASDYAGVQFTLSSDVNMRFQVSLASTDWETNGGTCTSGCDDHYSIAVPAGDHTAYQVSFDSLAQSGVGVEVPWDATQINSLGWLTDGPATSFAFSLDDVSFYLP